MRKFRSTLRENLDLALHEPTTPAAVAAKQLGLQYVGFGRYVDPRTNQVTHIVQNDQLVPTSLAYKTNDYKTNYADDLGKFAQAMAPLKSAMHDNLMQAYPVSAFNNAELDAIKDFTDNGHVEINSKLASLPAGISADQIVPEYDGDTIPQTIAMLDSVMAKSSAPIEVTAYASINGDMVGQVSAGSVIRFKGFRSLTIDLGRAINTASSSGETAKSVYILQVKLPPGSQGLYAENFSATPGESEFILPRGASIEIVDGPNKIIGSNAQYNINKHEINYYNCQLVM